MNSDDQQLACKLLDLDVKWLQHFDVTDPFNQDLQLQGYISRKSDHRYGALAITRVNGGLAPQVVYATPKLHYPFGKDGKFHFPAIKSIKIYEKLDGTNVFMYIYRDADGNQFTTFKLRLYPVLRNSRWGDFLDFWREILQRHPRIPDLLSVNDCFISFELYGNRNSHLMIYEENLAAAALFGVRSDATVVPPWLLELYDVPPAPLVGELCAGEDPVKKYAVIREEMERKNKATEDDHLSGIEGTVWYVVEPSGTMTLFKCKPESVEAIHWAVGINKASVTMTCWNLLETSDELSYETLLPLLLEEYSQEDIDRFRENIDACILQVSKQLAFRERVLAAYKKIGISLDQDKRVVMRALSQEFDRKDMKKVYTVIDRYGDKT